MKKKKRLLAILLAVILSVSATACSKPIQQSGSTSETTSSKKMTLEDVKKRVINEASEYLKMIISHLFRLAQLTGLIITTD